MRSHVIFDVFIPVFRPFMFIDFDFLRQDTCQGSNRFPCDEHAIFKLRTISSQKRRAVPRRARM